MVVWDSGDVQFGNVSVTNHDTFANEIVNYGKVDQVDHTAFTDTTVLNNFVMVTARDTISGGLLHVNGASGSSFKMTGQGAYWGGTSYTSVTLLQDTPSTCEIWVDPGDGLTCAMQIESHGGTIQFGGGTTVNASFLRMLGATSFFFGETTPIVPSFGTTTLNCGITFGILGASKPTTTVQVDALVNGICDVLNVTGKVTLDGTFTIVPDGGAVNAGNEYDFITSNLAITDTAATVSAGWTKHFNAQRTTFGVTKN